MLWMAIHFPHLALEVFTSQEAFTDPEGKPAPVPTTDAASEPPFVVLAENRIAHRNPAARTFGIELGTTLATAHAICPQYVKTNMTKDLPEVMTAVDGMITAEDAARTIVDGVENNEFLILTHPVVADHFAKKAGDRGRWVGGMRKLRRTIGNPFKPE